MKTKKTNVDIFQSTVSHVSKLDYYLNEDVFNNAIEHEVNETNKIIIYNIEKSYKFKLIKEYSIKFKEELFLKFSIEYISECEYKNNHKIESDKLAEYFKEHYIRLVSI